MILPGELKHLFFTDLVIHTGLKRVSLGFNGINKFIPVSILILSKEGINIYQLKLTFLLCVSKVDFLR